MEGRITVEKYVDACRQFCEISDKLNDGWKLHENKTERHKCYIQKYIFINKNLPGLSTFLKAEYVIFYNLSYGVPSFSFNVWKSTGVLLTLEEVRQICFTTISKENFYSVITQQEHPVMLRPYFIMHPCHTDELLSNFKDASKNIIVTFLGLITPLLKLNLPLEYAL